MKLSRFAAVVLAGCALVPAVPASQPAPPAAPAAEYQGVAKPAPVIARNDQSDLWNVLGLKLTAEPRSTFQRRNTRYRGGMRVDAVRSSSPAAEQGIETGDILVGMHRWETASDQDVQYIISRPNLADMGKIKFYVLRGQDKFVGHLNVAAAGQATAR